MRKLYYEEVQVGDRLDDLQLSISTTDVVSGALASRDYSPLHHDFHYVTGKAGHRDIFLNTPHQAAFFERYLGDWSGPSGRMGRMRFVMKASVYAGDTFMLSGEVVERMVDDAGCGWVTLQLQIHMGETLCTECQVRYALPVDDKDNPWQRRGEEWQP